MGTDLESRTRRVGQLVQGVNAISSIWDGRGTTVTSGLLVSTALVMRVLEC